MQIILIRRQRLGTNFAATYRKFVNICIASWLENSKTDSGCPFPPPLNIFETVGPFARLVVRRIRELFTGKGYDADVNLWRRFFRVTEYIGRDGIIAKCEEIKKCIPDIMACINFGEECSPALGPPR